jgi:hypothetical protein
MQDHSAVLQTNVKLGEQVKQNSNSTRVSQAAGCCKPGSQPALQEIMAVPT